MPSRHDHLLIHVNKKLKNTQRIADKVKMARAFEECENALMHVFAICIGMYVTFLVMFSISMFSIGMYFANIKKQILHHAF